MKRLYVGLISLALIVSGAALAQTYFNPSGTFSQTYAVLMSLTTGQPIGTASAPLVVSTSATSSPLTPAAISPAGNLTLVAGGTSQQLAAAAACSNFIYINNATTVAGEGGIAAAESIWVNLVGTAATATGGGSSIEIAPGVIQPFVAQTTAITWIAATTGHKINAVCE